MKRRHLTFTFAVTATLVALSSAAFACTTFKGKGTVTSGAGTSTAVGNNTGMGYCSNTSGATIPLTGGTISVSVQPVAVNGTCPASQLASQTYNVNFVNWAKCGVLQSACSGFTKQTSTTTPWKWKYDCMGAGGTYGVKLGTMAVTNGSGSGSYVVPDAAVTKINGTSDRSAVCVSDAGEGQGIQIPIKAV